MSPTNPVLRTSDDLLICNECGTQYDVPEHVSQEECKICEDPRQYVPATGQAWTILARIKKNGYRNVWKQDEEQSNVWSLKTEPKFAIGERAMLIQTDAGNVLWDLVTLLDQETVDRIEELGGLKAIVISHPHYYSTWADWSRTFGCSVYVGGADKEWLERVDTPGASLSFLTEPYRLILPGSGITAILAGGHFPGSLLLHYQDMLFIADTIFTSPSAMNPVPGKEGVISFTFFWSIPNRIPLHPDDILKIWDLVKPLEFSTAFGAFEGMDVRTRQNELERSGGGVKGRLLESCKIYVRAMGWEEHAVLEATL